MTLDEARSEIQTLLNLVNGDAAAVHRMLEVIEKRAYSLARTDEEREEVRNQYALLAKALNDAQA